MAIRPEYENKLKSLDMYKQGDGYTIALNFSGDLGHKMDIAIDALGKQMWQDIQTYMPIQDGFLRSQTNQLNADAFGEVYLWDPSVPYGHYQYAGELYVDPVYGKGAFYSPEYGFWSRPNVQKIPSGRPLTYQDPHAEARWDEAAYRDCKDKWLGVVRRALES